MELASRVSKVCFRAGALPALHEPFIEVFTRCCVSSGRLWIPTMRAYLSRPVFPPGFIEGNTLDRIHEGSFWNRWKNLSPGAPPPPPG